jgi:hypothetical protein
MSESASHQVFSTPELLEAICHLLPLTDLLTRLPLVNRTFQNIILSSPSLQEKLFFHPAPSGPSRPNPLVRHVPAEKRPRFIDKRDPNFDATRPGRRTWPDADELLPLMPYDSSARKAAFSRLEASWRRMFIVQPPIKELWMTTDEDGEVCQIDADGDWIRLGMLDEEVFAKWQTFGISASGRGGLMGYRDLTRVSNWWSLPPVLWPF